jgi:5-methyltetrahydropteroyltriglutamate--homocysteine methyltransferase
MPGGITGGSGVPHYEKYTTTVIGAHSVPRWYEAMDRLVSSGQLASGDFTDAQLRATQAAILEQEIAGIDVITGGEMHRRTHNRHSPPNAMLNHFWQKIPSFQGETKPKPITPHDPHVFHPAAIAGGLFSTPSIWASWRNSGQCLLSRASRSR